MRKQCFGSTEKADQLNGRVTDIKASPERGCKRIIVRERTYAGQSCAIDIPYKEAKDIQRKQDYSFEVTEKHEKTYGGSRLKADRFRTYESDCSPTEYTPGQESQFGNFGSSNRFKR